MTMSTENLAMLVGCLIPSIYIAYTDTKSYTIYDKTTFPVILAGLVNALYLHSLPDALLGSAFAFGLLFACALLGGACGGDVKYAAGLGLWLGFQNMICTVLIAVIIGTAWGAARLVRAGELTRLKAFFTGIYLRLFCGVRGAVPVQKVPSEDPDAPLPAGAVPFGACLAAGAWIVWLSTCLRGVV